TNDFIELLNRGSTPINLSGYSVQYGSSGGTSAWLVTPLTNATLQPGQYYLVREAGGTMGTTSLPAPDVTGTINMSAPPGKVALVNGTTALTGACPTGSNIIDVVGYGGANCSEGTPASSPGNNTSAVFRFANGCVDLNTNSADFEVIPANPRNSAMAANVCA